MTNHDPSDPLALGVAVFSRWREQRAFPGSHVPATLREIACLLLEIEPLHIVAQSLQIEAATVRRWRARHGTSFALEIDDDEELAGLHAADEPSVADFVPLPPVDECALASSAVPALIPALTIERTDGVRLHLGGPLEIATVVALLGTGALR